MRFRLVDATCLATLALFADAGCALTTWQERPPQVAGVDPAARIGIGADPRTELLAVRINAIDQGLDVLAVRLSAEALLVPIEALAGWRLRIPAAPLLAIDGRDHVDLNAVPGLRWQVDAASQTLLVEVPSSAYLPNSIDVVKRVRAEPLIASTGGFVNYDLRWQREARAGDSPDESVTGGLFEFGAFNRWGRGRHTAVWRRSAAFSGATRLDTSWSIDLPQSLSSVRVGDSVSSSGAWGRSVRFGGAQWATNFAVSPGLVSFPMPAVRGEAQVSSVVDLYVNSVHQLQGQVPPGAFDLPEVPVITGAGQIKMVVRDLLGREQVIVSQYYVSPALLRAGLHDFSLEAGTVREDYGLDSMRYGRAVLVATDRQGITDEFTRELRAEVLREQQTLGATGVWLVRALATANLSVVASRGPKGTGGLIAAGIDHQSKAWSAGVQARVASARFTQVGQTDTFATRGTAPSPKDNVSANIATSLGGGGFGVAWLRQSSHQGDRLSAVSFTHSRSLGPFGHVSMFVSRTSGTSGGTTLGINLIQSLGTNTSASIGSYRSRSQIDGGSERRSQEQHVAQVQDTAPAGPGFGYQLLSERGSYARTGGDMTWQTERFAVGAGAVQSSGGVSTRTSLSGAFAFMPEGVFASRWIEGSFAVVEVGDYEGVGVSRDNQFVGRTDSHGRALVTGLRGFETNRIGVDGADLPLDAQVDDLAVAVVPGIGSGVSVRFPVRRARTATLRLVTPGGDAIPAGSTVRIDDDATREFPVGFDGRVFLAGLAERSSVRAKWDGHSCRGDIVVPPGAEPVPELGTVLCR